ncbi:hypothetical protein [uncultured Algimonas sp.]|uniref:hypothetical protein n=1 Tax=uncultured Algimonas sp. TaxID=1547920 RepID=UPI00260FFECE|nr:hypothetical protein [uncultured Algimonas sp.]
MTRKDMRMREPVNRGPETGQSQRETPDNETLPPRADYRAMAFDADGYALTHNRNLFAASMWLSDLIDADAQWPIVANELRDYLAAAGHTPDHIDEQVFRLEPLIAPWLTCVRRVDRPT